VPHVNRDPSVGLLTQADDATVNLDPNGALMGKTPLFDIAHKAACPIAALFYFAAVGVVDHILKIGFGDWAGPNAQNLIRPDTKVTIGQKAVLLLAQVQATPCLVKDNKVVSSPLHFGERHSHGPHY
jgi:hypothetical protein